MFGKSKLFIALFLMTTVVPYTSGQFPGFSSLLAQLLAGKKR